MKQLLLILLTHFVTNCIFSQSVDFKWVRAYGNTGLDLGWGITADAAGNVYATGQFQGTIDVDPSPAIYNLTSLGNSDAYIIKLDAIGNFVWARQIGSLGEEKGLSVVLDNNGSVHVSGTFENTIDFDPGPGITNLTASTYGPAGFIWKLSAAGNIIWATKFDETIVQETAIDASGNVLATGRFSGITDFDPGPGNFIFTTTGYTPTYHQQDIFVLKLSSTGGFIWAKQVGGVNQDYAVSIALDAVGNVYTTGYSPSNTTDFDPGPGVYISPGQRSRFVLKLNVNGDFVWVKTKSPETNKIRVDGTGNIYTCGLLYGLSDFDPGPGVFNLDPSSATTPGNIFIDKLDAAGNFIWAKNFGGGYSGGGSSVALGMALDASGYIYTTGGFVSPNDFDPNAGVYTLPAITNTNTNVYVSKLSGAGNLVWAKAINTTSTPSVGYSIWVDAAENVYSSGYFQGTADFDPESGVYNATSAGGFDAYIHKMSQCLGQTSATLLVTACNAYTINNQTYTSSGIYTQILTNNSGCDSVITLNLTIGGSIRNDTVSACDTYTWQGQTLTTSGNYNDTLIGSNGCDSILNLRLTIRNKKFTTVDTAICQGQSYAGYSASGIYTNTYVAANGCDSIRTLNLVVKPRSYSTMNAAICQGQSYLGHTSTGTYTDTLVSTTGCDSIRTLHLVVNPKKYTSVTVAICQGQQYFAGGTNQTTTGVYKDSLLSQSGCDSIITTNLTVHLNPRPNLGADRNLCQGTTSILNPGTFATYVWQDQSTASTFNVTNTGIYHVNVTDANNCTAADTVEIKSILPSPTNFLKATDSICRYEKLQLQPSGNYSSYLWSTGGTQKTIIVDKEGRYSLTVKDTNGCIGTGTINILSKKCLQGIFVPTAFTPNGDGKNDIFKPVFGEDITSFKLEVYNRWGRKVFESTNVNKGWDGKIVNEQQPIGAYIWFIRFKAVGEMHQQFMKGTLMLLN